MEEIEVPTEEVQEHILHAAHESREKWTLGVALSSAFLAAFAALGALMAGHHSNEAMIEQIQASDKWSYYQAKGIKAAVLQNKMQILESLGKPPTKSDEEKLETYKKEQEEVKEKATEKESVSSAHLVRHVTLARSVTLFQVAIAIAAISVLTRRKKFWFVSLGFGFCGLAFLILGFI
jgi:alpha-galactosidase/6-phospho-beta-glucosidase family protein